MRLGEVAFEAPLAGYDALQSSERQVTKPLEIDDATLERFSKIRPHMGHLANESYLNYIRIHKVFVNQKGSDRLVELAKDLEQEQLPEFLEAAGWAFAEAALVNMNETACTRLQLMNRAGSTWERALEASDALQKTVLGELLSTDSQPFRIAMNLAYKPLMEELVLGNITDRTRKKVLEDTLAITQLANVNTNLAWRNGCRDGVADMSGFIQEGNAMMTLLLLDDPRFVPMPSSSRADSGYFHRSQTHDIVIINQHYGKIKKVIPVEIKTHPSGADRSRYNALILSKTDLTATIHHSALSTTELIGRVVSGEVAPRDYEVVDKIKNRLKNKLDNYQKQGVTQANKFRTKTRFYNNRRADCSWRR